MNAYALECRNISKSFPGVQALDDVSFDLEKGEVHALCGENGAGKSTLIKIITGLYQKDSGDIIYQGTKVDYKSTTECREHGIALIPQELQMAETLSVAENVSMANFPKKGMIVDWKTMRENTRALQQRLGEAAMTFSPEDRVSKLSMGQRQLVEIMKAISTGAELIAFDEPTSSLSDEETAEMFKLIRELTASGISIIYVSHRLAEIFEIADRVTVFKDGKYVATKTIAETNASELISMMVGREMDLYQRKFEDRTSGETVLEVKGLKRGEKVRDVSFSVHQGEILGMFGIVGSGRTETVRLLFGLDPLEDGEIYLHGELLKIKNPADAVARKIGFITEDRRGEGLALVLNVAQNMTMPYFEKFIKSGVLQLREEAKNASDMVNVLSIKAPGLRTRVETLSGGNQQKIVISKWLGADSEVLIFDEPTRGIDVGAKAEIHKLIDNLAREGKAVIMISSELPEVMAMADRILVFRDGEIKANLRNDEDLDEETILNYAIKTY